MNKKTSLYIDCPANNGKATIKITGPVEDAVMLLSEAAARILMAYFKDDMTARLAWAAAMSTKTVQAIADLDDLTNTGDPDDDEEDEDDEES